MCDDTNDVEAVAAFAAYVIDLGLEVHSLVHDDAEKLWLWVMVDRQAVHLEVVVLLGLGRSREDSVARL